MKNNHPENINKTITAQIFPPDQLHNVKEMHMSYMHTFCILIKIPLHHADVKQLPWIENNAQSHIQSLGAYNGL